MTEQQVREVALHLAPRTLDDASSELSWAVRAALFDELDDGEVELRLPDVAPKVAQWLTGNILFTASAGMHGARPTVRLRSEAVSSRWQVELSCSSAKVGVLGEPGLRTHWIFKSPNARTLELHGEIDIPDATQIGRPNSEEQFARAIAERIGWRSREERK